MKKFLLLLVCAGVLFGCGSKDDNKQTEKPKSIFNEPILDFGASESYVKNNEANTLVDEGSIDETTTALLYQASGYGIIYYFRNEKLINSTVILPIYTDMKRLTAILSSKYDYYGFLNGIELWVSESRWIVVGLLKQTDLIGVMYESLTKGPTEMQITPIANKSEFQKKIDALRQTL